MKENKPVKVFFSYAHEDEKMRDELAKHLSILERQGVISSWHDRRISAGSEWAGEIDEQLDTAQIILLLVSADFLASDFCYSIEMERALQRHNAGEAKVIPVILRDVDWQGAPFARLQALPKDAIPISSWENLDEAFADVARGIRKAAGSYDPPQEETTYRPTQGEKSERFAQRKPIEPSKTNYGMIAVVVGFILVLGILLLFQPWIAKPGAANIRVNRISDMEIEATWDRLPQRDGTYYLMLADDNWLYAPEQIVLTQTSKRLSVFSGIEKVVIVFVPQGMTISTTDKVAYNDSRIEVIASADIDQ